MDMGLSGPSLFLTPCFFFLLSFHHIWFVHARCLSGGTISTSFTDRWVLIWSSRWAGRKCVCQLNLFLGKSVELRTIKEFWVNHQIRLLVNIHFLEVPNYFGLFSPPIVCFTTIGFRMCWSVLECSWSLLLPSSTICCRINVWKGCRDCQTLRSIH